LTPQHCGQRSRSIRDMPPGPQRQVSWRRSFNRLLRFPATVRSTSDLHRRSILQPRFPINLQLSLAIHLPALPSNSTSNSHRLSDPSANLPTGLQLSPSTIFRPNLPVDPRLASPINLPAPPSYRPATCAACRSSGHAFQPTSSLRLRSIFQLDLPANLIDLRLLVNLPALPRT